MNERTIKLGTRQGIPLVREMITDTAICQEVGERCTWFANKSRRDNILPRNIEKLNLAIVGIASRLAEVHIEYSDDRQAVIDQIKEQLKPVKLKYIYAKHLGHDTAWWTYRTRVLYGNSYGYTFTEDEVLRINLAVEDIVARLRRIELVPEED